MVLCNGESLYFSSHEDMRDGEYWHLCFHDSLPILQGKNGTCSFLFSPIKVFKHLMWQKPSMEDQFGVVV